MSTMAKIICSLGQTTNISKSSSARYSVEWVQDLQWFPLSCASQFIVAIRGNYAEEIYDFLELDQRFLPSPGQQRQPVANQNTIYIPLTSNTRRRNNH